MEPTYASILEIFETFAHKSTTVFPVRNHSNGVIFRHQQVLKNFHHYVFSLRPMCLSTGVKILFRYRITSVSLIRSLSVIIVSYFIHLLPYVSCVAYPLIFTFVIFTGIRSAHAKIVQDQRRRFRSLTDEAGSQIPLPHHNMYKW
ncbi:unnamed protein product [Heligmosomoides polygyrus]|uniref:Transmembrane protein n=1 Tax=Heligmosomoides polygyrus TaxID=6339 RepID=A0A183FA70_HELPZ|nr:unnamed protein product [Heligmosomoides polygyrus]